MTPFEKFFEAWQKKLATVEIPADQLSGTDSAADSVSWDRKAAYMMFKLMQAKNETP